MQQAKPYEKPSISAEDVLEGAALGVCNITVENPTAPQFAGNADLTGCTESVAKGGAFNDPACGDYDEGDPFKEQEPFS